MKTFKQEVAEYLNIHESMVDTNNLETQQVVNFLDCLGKADSKPKQKDAPASVEEQLVDVGADVKSILADVTILLSAMRDLQTRVNTLEYKQNG